MKRIWSFLQLCVLSVTICLTGCALQQEKVTGEPMDFTVLNMEEIPKELQEVIEENKHGEIKMSYESGGFLYLVRGYGEQKTGGYSIAVNSVLLADDGIHVNTSLIGPPQDKKIAEEPSYPFIVLKIEYREEPIVFE